jgi:hypothetical protein
MKWISLMLWAGANPRSPGPTLYKDYTHDPECFTTAIREATHSGNVEVLKKLKPDPPAIRLDKVAFVESSWNGLGQSLMSSRANDFSGARDRSATLIRVQNSMIGRPSIRKMAHSRRHRQSWGMCTPRHIERRNPERCCQRWTPASDERCCKGTL